MKTLLLITGLFLALESHAKLLSVNEVIPAQALADGGVGVGNGGGMVICRDPSTRSIKSAELLDFYEARVVRDFQVDISKFNGDWKQKAQAVIDRLGKMSQLRQNIYSTWLKEFDQDSKFLKGVEFSKVPDSMHIGVPTGCEFEQAAIQILPRFKGDSRYYINDDIWSTLDENNKAGLILHEIIYREALSYGHTDSIATRFFLQNIASDTFKTKDMEPFIELLIQVHFEQTDIPFQDPRLAVEFDPFFWWRLSDVNMVLQSPKPIILQGRTVINLGYCLNEGCSQWKEFPSPNLISCYGVTKVWVPGYQNPVWVGFSPLPIDSEKHCNLTLELSERGDVFSLSVQNRLKSKPKGALSFNLNQSSISGSSISFSNDDEHYRLSEVNTRFIKNSKYLINTGTNENDDYLDCAINASFRDDRLKKVYFSTLDSSRRNCRALVILSGSEQAIRLMVTTEQTKPLVLDENEYYSENGEISQIYLTNNTSAQIACDTQDSGCIKILKFNDQKTEVTQVIFNGNLGMVHLPYSELQDPIKFELGKCKIIDGYYDLFPGTLVPKIINLREPCQLINVGKTEATSYAKGSILSLDDSGHVVQVINGGTQ